MNERMNGEKDGFIKFTFQGLLPPLLLMAGRQASVRERSNHTSNSDLPVDSCGQRVARDDGLAREPQERALHTLPPATILGQFLLLLLLLLLLQAILQRKAAEERRSDGRREGMDDCFLCISWIWSCLCTGMQSPSPDDGGGSTEAGHSDPSDPKESKELKESKEWKELKESKESKESSSHGLPRRWIQKLLRRQNYTGPPIHL